MFTFYIIVDQLKSGEMDFMDKAHTKKRKQSLVDDFEDSLDGAVIPASAF
jgi:hypothetical protein